MAVYFPNSLHSNKSPFRHQNRQSSHRSRNGATRLNNPTTFCASFLLPLAKFQFINMCFKLIYPSNSKYKLSPTSSVDNLYYRSRTTTQTPCTPISPYLGHLSNIYIYVCYIYIYIYTMYHRNNQWSRNTNHPKTVYQQNRSTVVLHMYECQKEAFINLPKPTIQPRITQESFINQQFRS